MSTEPFEPDSRTLTEYLSELRSGAPTPGGGSAAAYTGALGAALLAMVCRLTLKSPSADDNAELASAAARLDRLVDRLSLAARDDERCYGRYRAAAALPRFTNIEKQIRREAMQAALILAARSPLNSAHLAIDALREGSLVASEGTIHALSDVETALALLPACVRGSLVNVNVNIAMITDEVTKAELIGAVQGTETNLVEVSDAVEKALETRQHSRG